ncbi:hypothetical protein A3Q56_06391, partial [Intoshia linei]
MDEPITCIVDENFNSINHYKKVYKIGEGTYGIVYKSKFLLTGNMVTLKKVCLDGNDEGVPATTIRETAALRELKHRNVVSAPEILLGCSRYSLAVDIWSIGCIFAEISTRRSLFRGDSEIDQLFRMFRALKKPTDEEWPEMRRSKNYTHLFPGYAGIPFASRVPDMEPEAIDLLFKTHIFDPSKRITAKEALIDIYFENFDTINLPIVDFSILMTSMHEFKQIDIKDIERVSTTWDLLDNKESAIRFYKHLFTIYPQTKKMFVKFHNAKVDSLGTNAQALKIAKAMWGSASHIIISVSEGNLKEIYKSIDYLIKIHVNVPKFSPTMFEVSDCKLHKILTCI